MSRKIEAGRQNDKKRRELMPRKKIVKALNAMGGRYTTYEVFGDWVRCMALSIMFTISLALSSSLIS